MKPPLWLILMAAAYLALMTLATPKVYELDPDLSRFRLASEVTRIGPAWFKPAAGWTALGDTRSMAAAYRFTRLDSAWLIAYAPVSFVLGVMVAAGLGRNRPTA